jgi:ankyrin repeat protein/WD40 repeat protein
MRTTRLIYTSCLCVLIFFAHAQVKFPADFEKRMRKYDVRFTEWLLKDFKLFNPGSGSPGPGFAMFKSEKEKINVAYYVDTCYDHFNLINEFRNDLPKLFGLTEEKAPLIYRGNPRSFGVINTDALTFFTSDSAKKLFPPFTDYSHLTVECYYNSYTKGKVYFLINYEDSLEQRIEKRGNIEFAFIFYPHLPSPDIKPELTINSGLNDYLYALSCTNTGRLMAYTGSRGQIKILEGDGSKLIRSIDAHKSVIRKTAFSDNEKMLASCSIDSTIKIWDVETGKQLALFRHNSRVNDIEFYDDDRKLMSTSSDSTIRIWDLEKKTCVKTIRGFNSKASYFGISFGNYKAVVDIDNGNLMRLDLKTGSYTVFKSGLKLLTSIKYPYSNVVVMTDGSITKTHNFDDGSERIIADRTDSAFTCLDYLIAPDNNMKLIMMTDHGYCKTYDYDKHEVGWSFNFAKGDQSLGPKEYYDMIYNKEYDMVIAGGKSHCMSYDRTNKWFDYIWGNGRIPFGVTTDPKNEITVINFRNQASVFSLKSGRVIWTSNNTTLNIYGFVKLSKAGNLCFPTADGELKVFDYRQNRIIHRFTPKAYPISFVPLRNDSAFLYKTKNNDVYLHRAELRSEKKLVSGFTLKELVLVSDSLLLQQNKTELALLNIYTGQKTIFEKQAHYFPADTFALNTDLLALKEGKTKIAVYDLRTLKRKYSLNIGNYTEDIKSILLQPVTGELAVSNFSLEMLIIDPSSGKLLKKWKPGLQDMGTESYTGDGKFLITCSPAGTMDFWETKNYSLALSNYSSVDEDSYLTFIPGEYYVASANIQKNSYTTLSYYTFGNSVFDLTDLDLEYNRPDIIADVLGYESPEIKEAYHLLYNKRLKRMHREKRPVLASNDRPILRSVRSYPPIVYKSELGLLMHLYQKGKKVTKMKVSVNDVPIFGIEGRDIPNDSLDYYAHYYTINLNQGTNKVTVKAVNEDGIESFPYSFTTFYQSGEKKLKPKLHLIGIGVSEFYDTRFNLKYPAKDVKDFINLFLNQKNQFSEIIVDTLFNNKATRENILQLKEKLKKDQYTDSVGVNDKVILFLASHGVLDKNLDYYIATHDINFDNPPENGLLYSEIENLLDGIQPRNKVVMIDACHSGEIDKDEVVVSKKEPEITNGNLAFRSATSSTITSKEGALKNSLNLMKEMFMDLRKTSGATVISSAGGTEYAIEGAEWNNGVFTYSMINALRQHRADANNDNQVYLSELQRYIEGEVPRITSGKQQPTSRSENIANDILIWKNDFNEELAGAIKINDQLLADKLIREGADVSSTDSNGATTLMWAVLYSDLSMVKKLVSLKADLKKKGIIYTNADNSFYLGSLAAIAAYKNKMDILKYLIEEKKISVNDQEYNPIQKENNGWSPLYYAVAQENLEQIDYLLSKGANVNLTIGKEKYNLALLAFKGSSPEVCQRLLKAGLNYKMEDTLQNNMLINSVRSDNPEILKLAVSKYKEAVNKPDIEKIYPLSTAAFYGKTEQFNYLIANGAKTDILSEALETLLGFAVRSKNLEMVKIVYALCPQDLNKANKWGTTPLTHAAIDKSADIAEFLCSKGADINLKNGEGYDLEYIAKYYEDAGLLEVVKKYKK